VKKIPHFIPLCGAPFGMTMEFWKKGEEAAFRKDISTWIMSFCETPLLPPILQSVTVISSEARNLMLLAGQCFNLISNHDKYLIHYSK